jgi:hypothetical protein
LTRVDINVRTQHRITVRIEDADELSSVDINVVNCAGIG